MNDSPVKHLRFYGSGLAVCRATFLLGDRLVRFVDPKEPGRICPLCLSCLRQYTRDNAIVTMSDTNAYNPDLFFRGVLYGLLFSIPMWALIIFLTLLAFGAIG